MTKAKKTETKKTETKKTENVLPEYTEEQRSKDTISILQFMNLRSQERALTAELRLVQQGLKESQPAAAEAEKRLQAAEKIEEIVTE